MVAYWIAHVEVTDPDQYDKYAALAGGIIESHGGEFLARASRTVWLEGDERARNVIVKFPSVEDAERCYASDAYQEAMAFTVGASVRDLCIVEGADPS